MNALLRDANPPLTRSVEDYLKVIYHLSNQGGFAATSDIAAVPDVGSLADAPVGRRLELRRVGTQESARLHYRAEQGLTPGVLLTVSERQPFNGPTTIALVPSGDPRVVGRELAQLLWCREVPVEGYGAAAR